MGDLRAAHPAARVLPALVAAAALLVGGGLTVARDAGAAPGPPQQVEPDEEIEDVGAFLYGRDCAGCHGPEGEGSWRGIPLLDTGEAGAHYALVTGRMPIRDPDDGPQRGPVRYSEGQIEALVDHVALLGDGPALPDVAWRDADVPNGGTLYRLHCGACHSATAIGGGLAYGHTAPSLMSSEPSVVAAAIVSGPGAMPSFSPQGFTDDEIADVVAYVQRIQDPVDRGGWPIFRAGRADEGLVAWLIGVPVLLVAAGWIARRVR